MEGLLSGQVGVAPKRRSDCDPGYREASVGSTPGRYHARARRRREAQPIPAYDYRWIVARVRTGAEFAVADDLTAGRFHGYAPHGVKIVPRALAADGRRREQQERDYPLFPGYVFVGCPEGVYLGRRTHEAILDIVGDPLGRPGLSQAAMMALSLWHVGGQWNDPARARLGRKPGEPIVGPGDAVMIEDLCGVSLEGVVVELTRAGVKVEASMFGQATTFELALDKIKRAPVFE